VGGGYIVFGPMMGPRVSEPRQRQWFWRAFIKPIFCDRVSSQANYAAPPRTKRWSALISVPWRLPVSYREVIGCGSIGVLCLILFRAIWTLPILSYIFLPSSSYEVYTGTYYYFHLPKFTRCKNERSPEDCSQLLLLQGADPNLGCQGRLPLQVSPTRDSDLFKSIFLTIIV
jgi:hypothetical protein